MKVNKRKAKKMRKKVTCPLVDEFNLLTLDEEEYKEAMRDYKEFVEKYCRYKHYRDKGKIKLGIYHYPVGKSTKEFYEKMRTTHCYKPVQNDGFAACPYNFDASKNALVVIEKEGVHYNV